VHYGAAADLRPLGDNMKLSTYNPNNADEIEQLFIKTFSDSEDQSEGEVIGD